MAAVSKSVPDVLAPDLDVVFWNVRAIPQPRQGPIAGQLVYGSDTPVVDPHLTLHAVRGFGDAVARLLQIETPGALIR